MAGIYGVALNNLNEDKIYEKFYNSRFSDIIQEEKIHDGYLFGRSVLNKFTDDRFLYEDDTYILCFEGINYSQINTPKKIITAFERNGKHFVSNLKGVFSGFLYCKEDSTVYIFNDSLGTKSIYYYQDVDNGFAFCSEMHVLSKLLRKNDVPLSYDLNGIYSLALYGQMLDDYTVVKEIKRLDYGTVLTVDLLKGKIIDSYKYYNIKKEKKEGLHLKSAVDAINNLMIESVKTEWDKDVDNGYQNHFSLISGGMDAKVNAMLASSLGYNGIVSYTYGSPSSSDVKIAAQVGYNEFDSHLQLHLLNGKYLVDDILDNFIIPTDGLSIYTPSATMNYSLSKINFNQYGLLHSGQIGDVLFGSFVNDSFNVKKNKDKLGLTGFIKHKQLIEKIECLDGILDRYSETDYELFAYEQRQVNGTLAGDRVASNYVDHISPFYNTELIDYMVSIPNKYKHNQTIYFQWLQKFHPKILNYKWEKIGLKPNSSLKRTYGRTYKKYVNGGKKYFNLNYDSMNPIAPWMTKDTSIEKNLTDIFVNQIDTVLNQELKNDLKMIFNDNVFEYRNKFSVITVLLSLKLHFNS